MNVAVIGSAGFVGGELLRLLEGHPDVTAWTAVSRSQAGQLVADTHPALASVPNGREAPAARFAAAAPGDAARGRDVVFLALEHGASARHMAEIMAAGPGLIVDLAADFRLADPARHARYYGPHTAPELVERFVYALADIEGAALRGRTALAVPGCFATAAALALYPLAGRTLAAPPALFAITGSSGGGAAPRPAAHHPLRAQNLYAYGLFTHRHEAEIAERWQAWTGRANGTPRLLVHAGPFVRGIHLTLHARLPNAGAAVAACATAYADRPFVRVLDRAPELSHALGTNTALLHAAASDADDEIQILVALDNLIKGAAGQAIQGMNLALGLDETAGLRQPQAFP